ncbi:MAG TPA: DUF2249 domain-containing protein [Candidatus Competibacteraceae bacterium]|nr:DUF2249 domain-containing protein [Candidatus Competibacteraceae bacterium]
MKVRCRRLDVSALEPPEPLFITLEAVDELVPGEYLHLLHRREPHPLYAHLLERGMAYRILPPRDALFEMLIWRADDELAADACAVPEETE